MTCHAEADLWEEVSFLAYHLHWDLDTILDLEHGDRLRVLDHVRTMNRRVWEEMKNAVPT